MKSLWVDVRMPHKRNRRLKNHNVMKELEKDNPESEDIFEDDIFTNYYPNQPAALSKENQCTH